MQEFTTSNDGGLWHSGNQLVEWPQSLDLRAITLPQVRSECLLAHLCRCFAPVHSSFYTYAMTQVYSTLSKDPITIADWWLRWRTCAYDVGDDCRVGAVPLHAEHTAGFKATETVRNVWRGCEDGARRSTVKAVLTAMGVSSQPTVGKRVAAAAADGQPPRRVSARLRFCHGHQHLHCRPALR
jgi:hypothetical protein